MMRLLLVVVACAVGAGWARATHLVGGEMTYAFLGTDAAGNRLYEVHCFIYRDCGPTNTNGTGFDLSAAFAVYLEGALYATANAPLDASTVEQVVPESPNTCAILPPDLCIERAEYVFTLTLPVVAGTYTVVHSRCCRSPSVTNLETPEDQGFTLAARIPGTARVAGTNSSPSFAALPQAFVCNGIPFGLDNAAADVEGDSLVYSIGPIFLGGDPSAPMPAIPAGPPFAEVVWADGFAAPSPLGAAANALINPSTGLFTGVPGIPGKFALGIWVEEWREGVLLGAIYRDFTIDVVACAADVPEVVAPEPCAGLVAAFEVLTEEASDFSWDFGDGNGSTETSPVHVYSAPGVYPVSTTYTLGECSGTLWFNVVAIPPWTVELVAGDPMCTGVEWEWTWTVVGDVPPEATWTWETGGNWSGTGGTAVGGGGAAGSLGVETEWAGCVFGAEVTGEMPPLPAIQLEVVTEPCAGWEVTWAATGSDPAGVEWVLDGPATAGPPVLVVGADGVEATYTVAVPGTYTATATAGVESGCPASASLAWEVAIPGPAGMPVVEVLYGCTDTAVVVLGWEGGMPSEVVWSLPDGTELQGLPAVWAAPAGAWTVVAEATEPLCGEVTTAAATATVVPPLLASDYFLPNVFTPNGDGDNEGFRPEGPAGFPPGGFAKYRLEVYNRWGNLLFSSEVPGAAWYGDGHADGTYFARLQLTSACGGEPIERVQSFSLLR